MRILAVLFLLITYQHVGLHAQAYEAFCQNIYIWDVFQENGKKSTDPMIVGDIETAISNHKNTKVLNRRNFENIPLRIKNEKANQLTDKISDVLAKKLSDEGVKNILFTTLNETNNVNTVLNFKIYALQSRSIVLSKNLSLPKAVFANNREKRKELIADFFKQEVLGIEPPLKNTLVWSGVGVGAAATAFGVFKTLSIKSNWKKQLGSNPYDTENTYPSKNKSYKINQYVAIGGGLVLATSAYFVYQKMQKQHKQKSSFDKTAPKTGLYFEPLLDNSEGFGVAMRF